MNFPTLAVLALTAPFMTLALTGCGSTVAEGPLVNLGRLSAAKVYGSGVNGARALDDMFYGVTRAFDNDDHRVNDIAYKSWLPGNGPHWARISFDSPVTVRRIEIDHPASSVSSLRIFAEPGEIAAGIRDIDPAATRTTWRADMPLTNVEAIRFDFAFSSETRIDEIRILGPAPENMTLAEATPLLDRAFGQQMTAEASLSASRRQDALTTEIESHLSRMQQAGNMGRGAETSEQKARAALNLNRAADKLAGALNAMRGFRPGLDWSGLNGPAELRPFAVKAAATGLWVGYCEINRNWGASNKGYQRYLQLWPDGPDADEAVWMSALSNGPRCGDYEPSGEADWARARAYADFVSTYPNSRYAAEAQHRLSQAMARE